MRSPRIIASALCPLLASMASAHGDQKLVLVPQREHSWDCLSVAFNPDGKTLASGSWNGAVTAWNIEPRQRLATLHGFAGEAWLSHALEGYCTGSDKVSDYIA